tara:strand:- start:20 stop:1057 length:1038 start_codon:yes stop_codon:yes gene_type:complete
MHYKKTILTSVILASLSTSTAASIKTYPSLWSYEAVMERIEWAYQCGYLGDTDTISPRKKKHELLFDAQHQLLSYPSYPVFSRNGQGFFAPVSRDESCHIGDGVKLIGYKQFASKAQACSQQRYLAFYGYGITEGKYLDHRDMEIAPIDEQGISFTTCTSLYKYESLFYNGENDQEAFSQIQSLAQQGIASAQYQLGWFYFNGQYVEQNYAQAELWFEKAAKQGHRDAQQQKLIALQKPKLSCDNRLVYRISKKLKQASSSDIRYKNALQALACSGNDASFRKLNTDFSMTKDHQTWINENCSDKQRAMGAAYATYQLDENKDLNIINSWRACQARTKNKNRHPP